MTDIVIAGALRTAIGKFGGSLAKIPAPELGATVIRALLAQQRRQARADLRSDPRPGADRRQRPEPGAPGADQGGPARMRCPAMTINKVCGSGLKAVMLAAQAMRCGDADIVIAGGQENMSASPHVLPGSRDGFRMGDAKLVDTMIVDGLWDVYNQYHMGTTAENVAKKYDDLARAAGRVRRREPEQGRGRAEGRQVQGRDRPGDDPAAQGRSGRVRQPTSSSRRARRSSRSPACKPAFAKDGIGHGGQRVGPQRRRGRGARDDAPSARRSSASSRSRRSRRSRRRASIRRSWAWARCRRRSAASRRPAGSRPTST